MLPNGHFLRGVRLRVVHVLALVSNTLSPNVRGRVDLTSSAKRAYIVPRVPIGSIRRNDRVG